MKHILKILCAFMSLGLLLTACGGNSGGAPASGQQNVPEEKEEKIEIRIAGIKSDDDPASAAMQAFADEVNANSDTLSVKVFTNSVLGGVNDLLSGMTDGTVDMMYNTLSCYPWVQGAEMFNVVSAPFMWNDNAQLEAFLQTEGARGWFEDAAQQSGSSAGEAGISPPPSSATTMPLRTISASSAIRQRRSRYRSST